MPRSFRISRLAVTLLVALIVSVPGALLGQSATGGIEGAVVDTGGVPLPGASVTAKNSKNGATRTTTSSSTGAFTMPLLASGTYNVSAELAGFTTATTPGVVVSVGASVSVK